MARLLADENFPFPVVQSLRRLGHDVLTLQEMGKGSESVSDAEVLRLAIADRRAVATYDRKHFIRLHAQDSTHEGILVCTVDPDENALAVRIDTAIQAAKNLRSQLIRINRPSK